jgi:hypothetical protein
LVAFNTNKYAIIIFIYYLLFIFLIMKINSFRVMNNRHMYDATEIFRTLSQHKKECFIKLGCYLVSFFYYLYRYG